jgi:hypothetical protein
MYQLYIKKETGFETKKLIAEFKDSDSAYVRIETELAKDKDLKYILEETTGHVDSYGDLLATVVDEN